MPPSSEPSSFKGWQSDDEVLAEAFNTLLASLPITPGYFRSRITIAKDYFTSQKVAEAIPAEGYVALTRRINAVIAMMKGTETILSHLPTLYDFVHAVVTASGYFTWTLEIPRAALDEALHDLVYRTGRVAECFYFRKQVEASPFYSDWHEYRPWTQLECIGYIYSGLSSILKVKGGSNAIGDSSPVRNSTVVARARNACPKLDNLFKIVGGTAFPDSYHRIVSDAYPIHIQPGFTLNEYGEIRPREVSRCSTVPRPTTTVSRRQTRYRRLHPLPADPSFTAVPRARLSQSTLSTYSAQAEATPSGRHRSRSEQALEEEERRKLGPIIEWLKGASNGSHS